MTNNEHTINQIFTPPHIVREMLVSIPRYLRTTKSTVWYDPACGSGNMLIEIFNAKHKVSKRDVFIAVKALKGTEIDPILVERSRTRLLKHVIKFLDDNGEQATISDIKNLTTIINNNIVQADGVESIKTMRCDTLISNHPYHRFNNGHKNCSSQMYGDFILTDKNHGHSKFSIFLIPARSLFGFGLGTKKVSDFLLNDRNIIKITDYRSVKASAVFEKPIPKINDGVVSITRKRYLQIDPPLTPNITTHKENHIFSSCRPIVEPFVKEHPKLPNVFIRYHEDIPIIKKVMLKTPPHNEFFSDKIVNAGTHFGLVTNVKTYEKNGVPFLEVLDNAGCVP